VEVESGASTSDATQILGAASAAVSKTKLQYLAVPDDPALANSVCPICQEKFEMKWLDEAQDFVWMDAKKIGEQIYHASCYAELEAAKVINNAQVKRGTPEPVLGKRKNEASRSHRVYVFRLTTSRRLNILHYDLKLRRSHFHEIVTCNIARGTPFTSHGDYFSQCIASELVVGGM